MNMAKPRSQAGLRAWSGSFAGAAGPDEVVALAVFGLDQAGIDRRVEARIVQLDREIFALRLAGGLLPGCTKIRSTREDAEVGAALAIALRGDELHGLDVEAQGLDRAGEAVLGLGEGADGCHCRVPFSNRAAPIATSMVVVRPGTIGPHPKGTASAPDGRRRLFCFAMQSAARAAEKSWRRLLREDDRGEAGLRSDPIHSRSQVDGADGNYLEHERQQRHFAKDDGGTALVTNALRLNVKVFGHRSASARALGL